MIIQQNAKAHQPSHGMFECVDETFFERPRRQPLSIPDEILPSLGPQSRPSGLFYHEDVKGNGISVPGADFAVIINFKDPYVSTLSQLPVFGKAVLQLLKTQQFFLRHQHVYVIIPRNETLMSNRTQEGPESHLI